MKKILIALAATLVITGNASAQFTSGRISVSRVGGDASFGAGGATLNNTGTAVFIDEFNLGTTNQSLPTYTLSVPTTTIGNTNRFVDSGSATSELHLTRSTDGSSLSLIGYDATVGTASVGSAAGINRVYANIGANGSVNTTVLTNTFSANNARSAVATSPNQFYVGGNGTSGASGTGGIRYGTTSTSPTDTTYLTGGTPTDSNARNVNVFNNTLFFSTGATGPGIGLWQVGAAGTLPTTAGQSLTQILDTSTSGTGTASPYDFFIADSSTIYISDDRSAATGGGIQKWKLSGGSWNLAYTINGQGAVGTRGLTGVTDQLTGVVSLYATTASALGASPPANGAANSLVSISDTLSATTNPTALWNVLATAPANTAFRGVDFTPFITVSAPEPASGVLIALVGLPALRLVIHRRRRSSSR